ncbi:DUF547 domain-containing protein [Portibacter lacus]|nr:DUF547 domain-containing protein [Portibacter lacus]
MISTFLLILAMTFSCAEKNKAVEVSADESAVNLELGESFEAETPPILSKDENLEEKEDSKKQVNRVSKRFLKKGEVIENKEEVSEADKEWLMQKQLESIAEEVKMAKRLEKRDLVKNVSGEENNQELAVEEQMVKKIEAVDNLNRLEKRELVKTVAKPDHSAFNSLLSAHVTTKGIVDYAALKKYISKLDDYLSDLDKNSVQSDWSRNEKLAYWINAYNAFTIKLILDNYPVNSIQDISGGKPWDKTWIKLGGKTYSLNQIENDIIRPEFKEPRIHFAVNCAAQSCPPLANKAFTADNLNDLLEKQTKSFINNSKYNTIASKSVTISKIFDWYGVDFGDKIAFLNKYAEVEINSNAKIDYTEYNWSLNNK